MLKRLFTIISLFALSIAGISAQTLPAPVVRSDQRVVIENQIFYIHNVEPGQTLYSISRVYNVTERELIAGNPDLIMGLKAGQTLKIPFREGDRTEVTSQTGIADERPGEIIHTIEAGQTLFFLSQTYNVGIDEIIRMNPETEDGLSIGQKVRIPGGKTFVDRAGFETRDDNYIHHKVERGETLYSLSRKYDVPVRAIRSANDKLLWGLRYGEYVRIPKQDVLVAEDPPDHEDVADYTEHTIEAAPDDVDVDEPDLLFEVDADCTGFDYRAYGQPVNVVMLLPLFIDRNYPVELPDTIDSGQADDRYGRHVNSLDELYHETIPFLEFYEGARLAVDSLVSTGLSVNLTVYDTGRNRDKVREIMRSREFQRADLIIGPVYSENVEIVAEWAERNRVNVVSPFSSRRELLTGNPYLFQVTPSTLTEIEQASVFITNYPSSNFVLIHNNDPFERDLVESFKEGIFRNFSYSSNYSNLVFKEVVYTDATTNIEQSLVPRGNNIIVIPSSNQAFVSDVLMRLHVLNRHYDITIFGLNDWQRFVNLEVEYLHNMELHFASPFFIDYKDENVKRFLKRFRDSYNTEPSSYGFQGYDIMFYFLEAFRNYGPDFRKCLPAMRTELLQADFLFRTSDFSNGFENNGISIVRFDKDMSINRLGLNSQEFRP